MVDVDGVADNGRDLLVVLVVFLIYIIDLPFVCLLVLVSVINVRGLLSNCLALSIPTFHFHFHYFVY